MKESVGKDGGEDVEELLEEPLSSVTDEFAVRRSPLDLEFLSVFERLERKLVRDRRRQSWRRVILAGSKTTAN